MAEDTRDSLSLSDDENDDDIDDEYNLPELAGTLCKWTNYIHGWQDRYIVLKGGTLSYYKSETETSFGCRGAVSLAKALITPHEFDECRFDVSVNDCLWYLRARGAEEKQQWIDVLELQRQADSGYGNEGGLRRHGSMLSLASAASLSTASASSFKKGRGLREKLAEMETFRDILCRQVDTLQSYFDACASVVQKTVHDMATDDIDDLEELESLQKNGPPNGHVLPQSNGYPAPVHHGSHHGHNNQSSHHAPPNFMDLDDQGGNKDIVNILQQHGAHAIDFKGEAFTFKATTAGILATLSHCIELMMQREDAWRKRLEKEVDKNKKMKDAYKSLLSGRPKTVIIGGPDFEEGPHSIMHEEEFFDAVDATLDKLDREEEKKKNLTAAVKSEKSLVPPRTSLDPSRAQYGPINEVVNDHMLHADMSLADIASTWMLIAEDGEMKVYKRELMENGMVVDPLKAVHTVMGITGHELCHYFWDPTIRMEWEGTLDSSSVVEWLSKDTVITYQVHKRVWPATQRDSLFWSTIRHVPGENEDSPDYWCVVNHSTDHSDVPTLAKCVRIKFNVSMICQTIVQPPQTGSDITRDSLTVKIQYTANVNPGGWAPASVVRVISKRELPKFLKTFTAFVQQKTKDQPIMF